MSAEKILVQHRKKGEASEHLLFVDYAESKSQIKALIEDYIEKTEGLKFSEFKAGSTTEYKKKPRTLLAANGQCSIYNDLTNNQLYINDKQLIDYIVKNLDKDKFDYTDKNTQFRDSNYSFSSYSDRNNPWNGKAEPGDGHWKRW